MKTENETLIREFILVGLSNDRRIQILLFVIILMVYLLTIVGNLMIIGLVQSDSHLHTPMYYFLTHLSGLEIIYVTSTMPQMLAHLLSGNGAISFIRCAAQMYIAMCLGSVECFLLAAMAYDRYMAICNPLGYALAMGRWRQTQLAAASWTGGFLLASINVVSTLCLPFCTSNRINHFFCDLPVVLKLTCADRRVTEPLITVIAASIILIPFVIILTSYGLILFSVLQIRSAAGLSKAFSTCSSHLMVVSLFYGTLIFMYMRPWSGTSPDREKHISVFYVVVTPLLNPVIYTLRNKDVHGAVVRLVQRWSLGQKS